jgi:hypothetical protein
MHVYMYIYIRIYIHSFAGVLAQSPALALFNLSYNDIGNFGAEGLAGVMTQCAALAYLNLSSKAEIRKDIHISEIQ